jgi:NADPH-dependent ferric siderophore reductase
MRPFPLRTGMAEVLRLEPLGSRMTRFVLGGEALAGLPLEQPGEIVTLLWPAPGRDLVLPEAGWRFPPGVAAAQHARNYTVRAWDAAAGELSVDFVLHGDHGRAARWAAGARPGDRIGFAGPRVHWQPAGDAAWSLLVADETGLPALAAIAETLPPGHRALALVEVGDAGEEQPVDCAAELDLRWLHRDGAAPGTTTLLADAVRALDLPAGRGRAWGAGEALAMRDVRRHLRETLEDVDVLGYWKHRNTPNWD